MNKLEWDELFWSYRTHPSGEIHGEPWRRENVLYRKALGSSQAKCQRMFVAARYPERPKKGKS
jgi:hypothetical protein